MAFTLTETRHPDGTSVARHIVADLGDSRVTLSIQAEEQVQLSGERVRYDAINITNAQLADVLVQIAAKALNSRYAMNITAPAED